MTEENQLPPRRKFPVKIATIAAAMLGLGAVGGGAAISLAGPSIEMAPVRPVAISSLKDDGGIVTLRGKVADRYGSMFVLADGSGKALVDAGLRGDGTGLVATGTPVTVQGRYRDGVVRASFLVGADGKVTALGPRHGRHGGHGRGHERGHGGPGGPGMEDDMMPPPPPAVPGAAAPGNSAG